MPILMRMKVAREWDMAELVTMEEIRAAQRRLAGVAVRTGLYRVDAERLRAAAVGAGVHRFAELPFELWVKAENEQPIGSFKLRGAYNRVAQMSAEELGRGVITYSSGNHGQGVGYAARALGAKAVVVMPENAPAVKIEAIRTLGAEVVLVGPGSEERRAKAEALAAEFGYTVVPPYDDPAIVAGQATCGLEILEQLGAVSDDGDVVILSPVSGGGLLSGIASAVKLSGAAGVQVWGAEPELAADAKESFETKTLVEWPAERTTRTISDGLRTQSLGQLNFEHILRFVDGIVTVGEGEIVAAMRVMLAATGMVAEPSGAVTMAAALFHHAELPRCERMVVVLSGGNIEAGMRLELEAEVGLGGEWGSAQG
jgi:threo-3-hydroxy-L-aspartate ammonia-lyase